VADNLKTQRIIFVIAITIISTIAGGLLGILAEVTLYSGLDPAPAYAGMQSGLASGLLVGLLYCAALARCRSHHGAWGLFYGVIAALASSTFVHTILMRRWPGSGFGPMFAGDLFALVAGLILGGLAGQAWAACCIRRTDGTPIAEEESKNA